MTAAVRAFARPAACLAALLLLASAGRAHELRPAFLELKQVSPDTFDVLFKVPARGERQRLALHLRLPDDVRLIGAPAAVFSDDAEIERTRVMRDGGFDGSEILIEGLGSTMTDALVRVERADGTTQVARLTPDRPSFVVEAAPRAFEVVGTYLALGVEHILLGVDHLLFVLALLILVPGRRRLVGTITAFTVAHSITLGAATLGCVSVPGRPVEAVIALSIAFVACEIVRG